MTIEPIINIPQNRLDDLLEDAAERGARKALEKVGLHDPQAGKDINDLRDLIESWRTLKLSALTSVGKVLGLAILGGIALLFGGKYLGGGH